MSKQTKKRAAPPRSQSQALVRVANRLDRATRGLRKPEVLAALASSAPSPAIEALSEAIALGSLGLVEVKLTQAEELILAEPVNVADILIKPTGQPYISHPAYTKWFNRAFGRLGWALVPRAKPALSENGVLVPYVLYIHTQPAAFAIGEQDYHGNNREQTYGDAIESTVASGLRRCAKRMGVGLELWDKRFINKFIREHCICVLRTSKNERAWRRVDDDPFFDEAGNAKEGEDVRPAQRQESRFPPRSSTTHRDGRIITEKQLKRLWVILRNSWRPDAEVKEWLASRFKISSTKLITQDIYEQICTAIEARGELPPGPDALAREAGAEG